MLEEASLYLPSAGALALATPTYPGRCPRALLWTSDLISLVTIRKMPVLLLVCCLPL